MQLLTDIGDRVDHAARGYNLSIENLLQVGFNIFRSAPGPFILYSFIVMVVISNPVSGLLLAGPVITSYYIVARLIDQGRLLEVPDFFRSFDKYVPLLILHLLMALIISLGLIMLVIPGIYFAVSYIFAHFFVWFYDVEPTEAIRLSRRTVAGNFWQVLLLCLVLLGINMLGALAFGVGLLLTFPLSYCVLYAAFDDIIGIPK